MALPDATPDGRFRGILRRMSKRALLVFAAGATLLSSLSSAPAGAAVTIVVQNGTADAPNTVYLDGKRMRVDGARQGGREASMIMDGAGKRMIILNDKEKTYSEITQEDMKKMRARVDAMRAQAAERMKNLPPEQRKQMEKMMGGGLGGDAAGKEKEKDFKFEKMGDKKTVNGFACEMYRIVIDGKPAEEDCVSPWSAGIIKMSDFEGLREFAESMLQGMGGGPKEQNWFMFKKRFDQFPGFPVTRVVLEADGKRRPQEEVKSVKRGSIDAAKFATPAGYTKTASPFEQMGGPPGGPRHGGPGPMP
jgi:Domain of unknown function (DUF4412)